MSWRPCGCGVGWYQRVARAWWMRLLFAGRLRYRCSHCGCEMFVRESVLHAHLAARR